MLTRVHHSLKTITAYVAPLTAAQLRPHLRVDLDVEDALDDEYIAAAAQWIEGIVGRPFAARQYQLRLDDFPSLEEKGSGSLIRKGQIVLPRAPVTAVGAVKHYDAEGAEQTLVNQATPDAVGDYWVDIFSEPAIIEPAYGTCWPETRGISGAVLVEFTAGAADPALLQALRLLAATWYDNREAILVGERVKEMPAPANVMALLAPRTLWAF